MKIRMMLLLLLLLIPLTSLADNSPKNGFGIGVGITRSGSETLNFHYQPHDTLEHYNFRLSAGMVYNSFDAKYVYKYLAVSEVFEDNKLFAGLGVLVVDHTSYLLSSKYEFISTFGYKFSDGDTFYFQHISNAGLQGENHGENLFVLSKEF